MDYVYLLYEGDEWLTRGSMVLMGVLTNQNALKKAAEELIMQRADEHLETAKENYDFGEDATQQDVIEDILIELLSRRSTNGWLTNYSIQKVETDKLEEI